MIIFLALSYRSWYILFHDQSSFTIFHNASQTSAVVAENLLSKLSIPKNDCNLDICSGMSVNTHTILGSGPKPCCEIISAKRGMLFHLKRHLSLLSLKFTGLHILSTLSNVPLWSLPNSTKASK